MRKDRMLDELSVLQERFASGMGWRDGEYAEALDEAIEMINNMPSADVVRCKDCEFYDKERNGGIEEYGYCEIYKGYKKAEGYCDCGERREMK